MVFHPDSPAMVRYLMVTIEEIARPADIVAGGSSAKDIILGLLTNIGTYFANIEGGLLDNEALFLAETIVPLHDVDLRGMPGATLSRWWRNLDAVKNTTSIATVAIANVIGHLRTYDYVNGTHIADSARAMFFRFANAACKSDGKVTRAEQYALTEFKKLLYAADSASASSGRPTVAEESGKPAVEQRMESSENVDDLIKELNSLIGLERVKTDALQIVNFLKIQRLRQSKGLETPVISRHLVFYGNPGTGKTTIARLLAQIYKALGILKKGHLVETDRAGLVAGYLGQTAIKATEVCNSALGGILFIDEAYTLQSQTGEDSFGEEAIDTLLKMMEDNRDNLIVVVAGYPDKMDGFVSSNPGLRSRFNKYLSFADYTPAQLCDVFELFCKKAGYQTTQFTMDVLLRLFSSLYEHRDKTFGNARLARNIFEKSISNQADRIVSLTNISMETLSTITETDIPRPEDLRTIAVSRPL